MSDKTKKVTIAYRKPNFLTKKEQTEKKLTQHEVFGILCVQQAVLEQIQERKKEKQCQRLTN